MIPKTRIPMEQVEKILALEETDFVDMKSKEIQPAKLSKTISAFANSDGDEIYIGVTEDKVAGKMHWDGFVTMEEDTELPHGGILPWGNLFNMGASVIPVPQSCGVPKLGLVV